jgi:hypothetical protein
LIPGLYTYHAYVSKGSGGTLERHTVLQGNLEVLTNLSAEHEGYDARSTWRIIKEDCETALKTWAANGGPRQLTLGGRTQVWDREGVISLLSKAEAKIALEDKAERIAKGLGSGKKILTRFV